MAACPSCAQGPGAQATVASARPDPVERGACGPVRNVVVILVLTIVTCGIWNLVAWYRIATDINTRRNREELNPALDILLLFLTCGLWGFYMMYRYPTALSDMQVEEGEPTTDLMLPCIILYFVGLGLISTMLMQTELNKHWERHGARAV